MVVVNRFIKIRYIIFINLINIVLVAEYLLNISLSYIDFLI